MPATARFVSSLHMNARYKNIPTMGKLSFTCRILLVTLFIFLTGSCRGKRLPDNNKNTFVADTTTVDLDIANVDSMRLLFRNNGSKDILIGKEERSALTVVLGRAHYETQWNTRGAMVKMPSPDYSIRLSYYDGTPENYEWISFWLDGGLLKYRSRWYYLDDDDVVLAANILGEYITAE